MWNAYCWLIALFIDDKEKAGSIDETKDRNVDWYISNIKKSTILSILLCIKDILGTSVEKEPTRREYESARDHLITLNPNFGNDIIELKWEKVRQVTMEMWHKY